MNLLESIRAAFAHVPHKGAAQLSPLVLAYMGDCIYDLYARTLLIEKNDFTVHKLHVHAAKHVNAGAQSISAARILPVLTEREMSIYKRGRNAHMGTVAKNASIADYRSATGLEALIGYLYLEGEDARLTELMTLIFDEGKVCASQGDFDREAAQHDMQNQENQEYGE